MLTTRGAAQLLAGVRRAEDLPRLVEALGFAAPLTLARRDRRRLGIAPDWGWVAVAPREGTLRALVADGPCGGAGARGRITELCRGLVRGAPDRRWMVVAHDAQGGSTTIAVPAPDGRAIAALTVEPGQVRGSDGDTLAALAAVGDGPDALVHLRWREALGREALTRRFYRDLERCVEVLAVTAVGRAREDDRRTLALLQVSRLLFLSFLEAKGWLDGDRDFLRRAFDRACGGGTHAAHRRLLEPLCFGTLNTRMARRAPAARAFGRIPFLNGGLFTRTPLERRHRALRFTDDAIGEVIGGLLAQYRITAREAGAGWSDAAVDPEMLGRAFESLMAADDRAAQGAFYTPQPLIERITGGALAEFLPVDADLEALDAVRLLDPACGSGAFLVHALETLADRRADAGDARPRPARRRHVLTRSIFGVDRDPTAVWLCQLRLWLSVVVDEEVDDPARVAPLPNLDRNVREGDALAGSGFEEARLPSGAALERLRLRYARASGARKRTLARALDRAERARAVGAMTQRLARLQAVRRELLVAARGRDLFRERTRPDAAARRELDRLRRLAHETRTGLRRLRDGGALPFSFATHFPEAAGAGGFPLVIGNPPWVRPHDVPPEEREALRERFITLRAAAWEEGAAAAAAGRGFASQADLAAAFVERALQLTVPGGIVALLLPSKLWGALAGGGVRRLLAQEAPPLVLEEWTGSEAGFGAVVYPSALLARRSRAAPDEVRLVLHRAAGPESHRAPRAGLALDGTPGAPWLLLPTAVRAGFDALAHAGVPLAASAFGRPLLGVKSGCNEAFIVRPVPGVAAPADGTCISDDPADRPTHAAEGHVRVRSGTIEGVVAARTLRPVLRGEQLRAWTRASAAPDAIVWTHDRRGVPAPELPAETQSWLQRWRRRLEMRADGRGGRWWALFRTEAAASDRARVVWGDIGRTPRAVVLPAGDPTVPLNTCYVVRAPSADDAHALAALLNSRVASAWLGVLAEPARGGYRRFLGWTCARLPLPRDWPRARALLAPLGRAGAGGQAPADATLTHAVLSAYGVEPEHVAPLLAWSAR